jgi:hypothetical protein
MRVRKVKTLKAFRTYLSGVAHGNKEAVVIDGDKPSSSFGVGEVLRLEEGNLIGLGNRKYHLCELRSGMRRATITTADLNRLIAQRALAYCT